MENNLYKVDKIEGKGVGCIALQDIKPGTLILKEVPQCVAKKELVYFSQEGMAVLLRKLKNICDFLTPTPKPRFSKQTPAPFSIFFYIHLLI